ncbi:MAG TPA: alpha/beta hydrolase-fold protein [Blastocatellia bacterium]|nr:alpha/beta hydrolase-fold protein [Blastocatellia bacterium]
MKQLISNLLKLRKRSALYSTLLIALAIMLLACARAGVASAEGRLRFKIGIAPGLAEPDVSGRLLIFMTQRAEPVEMIEPSWFDLKSVRMAAMEVHDLAPGKTVEVDPDQMAFPAPFSTAPAGDYQVMALLDVNHDITYYGPGAGDLRSEVVRVAKINPADAAPIELTITKREPERQPPADTDSIKLVTFESPSLSAFWGRPITMRAGVVLPPGYAKNPSQRYPTVYQVHGFGGNHMTAWRIGQQLATRMTTGAVPEMIYVFLDGTCPMGHHEFADSANNGPWGRALTSEFIPYLESKFRMDARPRGRFLTGHSSGGWSTLWLQITYPDFFGGTWSTSPDPVDFRNFTGPDLTRTPPQNFYRNAEGKPYNLIRFQGREIATLEEFARMEQVMGEYGGQMSSFEAVFSPRGEDGRPMPLFDRKTGRINPAVQKAWERYDISRILRTNWKTLGPRLHGKIHIIVGTADNFHLEEPVMLLRDVMKQLGSDATFEFIEGRDHMDLYQGGLADRIAQEIYKTWRGPQAAKAAH